jgi:hypothetical protein
MGKLDRDLLERDQACVKDAKELHPGLARGSATSISYRAHIPDRYPQPPHTYHVDFVHKKKKGAHPALYQVQMTEHNARTWGANTLSTSSTPQSTSMPLRSTVHDIREREAEP